MSFNSRNYYELREAFEKKHLAAAERADARRAFLAANVDGVREIDAALAETAPRIFGAALAGKDGLDERIAKIRAEIDALRAARAKLLLANGYPADYSDVHYDCEKCKDLGFADGKICTCFRRALILRGYETSGIGNLIEKQTFENFSLDYYKDDREAYDRMRKNLEVIRTYAETFTPSSGSLLFMGGTGLGKTHLSSAVTKTVIDRGYDALYVCAQDLFADFEKVKFRGEADGTDRYFSAELLLIDDLGTELAGSFTEVCLYNVVNTRLLRSLPTVISTNLNPAALTERYSERISSRLFGEYRPLLFCGTDVRMKKL